ASTLDERGDPLAGRVVVWSSDDEAVALVDSAGLVTAIGEGMATITAASEGVSAASNITVKPFVVPVATARSKPIGDTVRVEGIVLSSPNTFGDNTLHLSDTSAAIRGTGISASVFVGDSVRLAGLLGLVSGQPVIESAGVTKLGTSMVPDPASPLS
ncbi:MAG: Ig-like domain-containing protein, partial [Gemmatimonadota bacterium]